MQNKRKRLKEIKFQKKREVHKLKMKEAKLVYELTDPNSIFKLSSYIRRVKIVHLELECTHIRMKQLKMNLDPIAEQLVKDFIVKLVTDS
jgi:hypothetical protein